MIDRSFPQRPSVFGRLGLALALISLSACVTVEGESSGEMKSRLQNSYLYTSVKRFYPDGVPADPATVYPQLQERDLRAVEAELQGLSRFLVQRHAARSGALEVVLKLAPVAAPKPKFVVQRTLQPIAFSSSSGEITFDVRVLQAVFRGALLTSAGEVRPRMSAGGPESTETRGDSVGRVDPELQTERQRRVIQDAVDMVKKIDATRGRSMLGDFVGMAGGDGLDSSWFRMSDLLMQSQQLQVTYTGAVLFLMAHEMGHIALGHHSRNTQLQRDTPETQRTSDSPYCTQRRDLEFAADAYALLLLTHSIGESGLMPEALSELLGLEGLSGYDSFFRYGYPLAGFDGSPGQCNYPTADERRAFLSEGEATLRDLAGKALEERMSRASKDRPDPSNPQRRSE